METNKNNIEFGSSPYNTPLLSSSFDSDQSGLEDLESWTGTEEKINRLMAECLELGVKLEEKSLTSEEVLSKLSQDCVAIVLLDWSKVKGEGSFQGHFLPIVGYDDEYVYLHQPGPKDAMPNFKIEKKLFDEARISKGTDEDIVFIYRK